MEIELCGILEKDVWIKKDSGREEGCSGFYLENKVLKLCPLVEFCPRLKKEVVKNETVSACSI